MNKNAVAEFCVRQFFDENGGYAPAKNNYSFPPNCKKEEAVRKVTNELMTEEKRKFDQFLSFCKFMIDKTNDGTFVLWAEKENVVLNESDLMLMFAIGCEMIERKVDFLTIDSEMDDPNNVYSWILNHVGMIAIDTFFSEESEELI